MNPAVAEQIRSAVEARLDELQPVVTELEQLQGVLALLDAQSARGDGERAPQGSNKRRIVAVIAEHPGIAAPQIARLTGLKRPLVASTISRMKSRGELLDCEEGVRLPSASARRPHAHMA
jgi:hypothetical protein